MAGWDVGKSAAISGFLGIDAQIITGVTIIKVIRLGERIHIVICLFETLSCLN